MYHFYIIIILRIMNSCHPEQTNGGKYCFLFVYGE